MTGRLTSLVSVCLPAPAVADAKIIEPVHEYDRSQGAASLAGFSTGGKNTQSLLVPAIISTGATGEFGRCKPGRADRKVASNTLLFKPFLVRPSSPNPPPPVKTKTAKSTSTTLMAPSSGWRSEDATPPAKFPTKA